MWRIEKGVLKVKLLSGREVVPSVADIFNSKEGVPCIIEGESCISPRDELDLSFSSFGLQPRLMLDIIDGSIQLSCVTDVDGRVGVPAIDDRGLLIGYVIHGLSWYYLTQDYCEAINEFLLTHGMSLGVSLSLRQYMELIRDATSDSIPMEDNVKEYIEAFRKHSEAKTFFSPNINATLYPYQTTGCRWMHFMVSNGCGFVLGDEMGLGKTLQIIALLSRMRQSNDIHCLVVVPLSLVVNWSREIKRFATNLTCYVHNGPKRTGYWEVLARYDIVITTYSNIVSDFSVFNMIDWDYVVLDEAQNIKTPEAKRTRTIKRLRRKIGIAVTGTPFENHMTDLWSIYDFVMPNYVGKLSQFESKYTDTVMSAKTLEPYLTALMIRRKVSEVATDLPPMVLIPHPVEMMPHEAKFYEEERQSLIAENEGSLLAAIQRLRILCTHPNAYANRIPTSSDDLTQTCSKYSLFIDILTNVFEHKEKAIVFTSFNSMMSLIRDDIRNRFGVFVDCINGAVPANERQIKIDDFAKHDGAGVLILNPRAAGVGLNITCANHVIHYNLEWNPAIEDQATARAYRRGQTHTVFVHRIYNVGTIEELVNDRIENKRDIFNAAVCGTQGAEMEKADLRALLEKSPI